ncbi:MAG: STAS domain-containing protein [Solirubrobacterales bacterium]
MPYELNLATRMRGLAAIVQVGGTLDLHGVPDFDREIDRLLRGESREILVDLRQVEFMDSLGLRSLVRAHRLALRAGVPLWVVRGGAPVARVLRMTGLDVTLPLIDELPLRLQRGRPLTVAQRDMRISSGNR